MIRQHNLIACTGGDGTEFLGEQMAQAMDAAAAAADEPFSMNEVGSGPAAVTTAPTDDLRSLLALRMKKDEHEAALKAINAEIEETTERILDRWVDQGVDSMRVDGKTISLRRQIWARVLDREHVAEALREAGLEAMLTPNTNTLSAWLREKEEAGEQLPQGLEGIVGTYEKFSLSVRNGRS